MGVVDDIRARLDIVSVVSEYVALQKAGRSFKAACPFHSERTPSFHVNPERQSWRCFGACATGGDIFSFVMRKENLEFGDALRLLAQKAGVELITKSQEERDHNDVLYSINKEAARFYREALASPQGATARKYLDGRGVNAESRARFELGFSLDSWDSLKSHLLSLGFREDDAIAAGLLHKNESGKVWDFFRGRLMFPIHDRQGRVAGFGARALDDSTPKYINTSQTPIFNKRDTLYALHLAAGPIRTQNAAVIVEGYMDAIAAHEHGYNNVVASMGTALTEQQVAQLKSIAKNIILALDADAAGQQATQRDLDATWQAFQHQKINQRSRVGDFYFREPFNLKVALISQGHDPDELIRQDANQWEQLIQEAIHFLDFRIPAIARQFDISTGQGKAQVVEMLFPMIASLDNQFDQERYFSKLAQTLGVTEEALKASVSRPRARSSRRGQS
ncbi:MAG: DNA primase, partial [Chloroflexi bacterium]|nr:DNA primase [Chloroflexota bacterium]